MIVVATNQKTGERIEFPLLKLAAVHAGIKRTSMSYRVKTGHVDNNGWTYTERVLTKKEMTKRQLLYLKQKEATKQKEISERKRERFAKRPHHISYEKNSFGVCITPCPYFEHPKPMIGSARCQGCAFFEDIDRKQQQVACKKKNVIIEKART